MPSLPIAQAAKITWEFHDDVWPELSQFGIHTVIRDFADWEDLLDVAETFIPTVATVVMAAATMERIVYSEWGTAGFTGFHQRAVREVATAFGSGAGLPHQCALSVGYRNTSDFGVPLGRRRNRFYFGPLKASLLQADTRLSTSLQGNVANLVKGFHDVLKTVPDAADDPGSQFGGMAVVSAAAGLVLTADQLTLGQRFDTIRSRAEHTLENTLATPITP